MRSLCPLSRILFTLLFYLYSCVIFSFCLLCLSHCLSLSVCLSVSVSLSLSHPIFLFLFLFSNSFLSRFGFFVTLPLNISFIPLLYLSFPHSFSHSLICLSIHLLYLTSFFDLFLLHLSPTPYFFQCLFFFFFLSCFHFSVLIYKHYKFDKRSSLSKKLQSSLNSQPLFTLSSHSFCQ